MTVNPDVIWRIELVTVTASGVVDESMTTLSDGVTTGGSQAHDGSVALGGASSVGGVLADAAARADEQRPDRPPAGPPAVTLTVPATGGSLP